MTRQFICRSLLAVATLAYPISRLAAAEEKPKPAEAPIKAQWEVAGKVTLSRVSTKDDAVKSALKATDLTAAAKLEGKSASFHGTVVKVYAPDHHKVVVLNFAKDYRTALTAALRPEFYTKFPDLRSLEGKHVLVTGKLVPYRGALEVLLTDPKQLKLVD